MKNQTKLRTVREQKGVSLEELRKRTKIPRISLYRYEQGIRIPNAVVGNKIAAALGTTSEELWKPNTEL